MNFWLRGPGTPLLVDLPGFVRISTMMFVPSLIMMPVVMPKRTSVFSPFHQPEPDVLVPRVFLLHAEL